jgi:hypothetical protein
MTCTCTCSCSPPKDGQAQCPVKQREHIDLPSHGRQQERHGRDDERQRQACSAFADRTEQPVQDQAEEDVLHCADRTHDDCEFEEGSTGLDVRERGGRVTHY